MKIKPTKAVFRHGKRLQLTIMKFFIFLLCTTAFGFTSVNTFSQEKITIDTDKEVSVDEVFRIIKNQTEYRFLYPEDMFSEAPNVELKAGEIELGTLLNRTLAVSKVRYKLSENNTIVIETSTSEVTQGIQITGTVKDQNNVPLPGVNILEKGTTNGTQTDFDGNYSLNVSNNNSILVFSYVGYASQEILVNNQRSINITLKEDLSELDEVVVIGYGTVKKRDLTGAVSSVDSEEIKLAPVVSPIEAIQGRVAGLDIARNDGRAGSSMSILLRGNRSLTAGSEPIYIIDGIQGNPNFLNPNDIESIDVLKDASSTSIYGSAGANGVIIITTKKAKEGKMQVDVDSYISINANPSYPSALQGQAWFDYLEAGYMASQGTASASRDDLLNAWSLAPGTHNPYLDNSKYVNWVDETFKTGIQTNNTISIRGGTEKLQASFSLGHNKTEGIYVNDHINVYTMRSDVGLQATDWVKFGLTTGLNFRDNQSNRSRVNRAFGLVPLGDVYDENGMINRFPIDGEAEPSILANNIPGVYDVNNKSINITANPYIDFNLTEGLTLRSILGVSLSSSRSGQFESDQTYLKLTGSSNPISTASYNTDLAYSYNWENILDYKTTIDEDHEIGATFITSYAHNQSESSDSYSEDFLTNNSLYFNLRDGSNFGVNTAYSHTKRMSYAGRLNYNYKGKYLLTGSIRADGWSQLSDAKEWDVFPAGAIAWRISSEDFMSGANWLSDLKVRAGYGVGGNANIRAYASLDGVSSQSRNPEMDLGGGLVPTIIPTITIGNDNLSWEKSYNLNIGLDFGLFKNRVNGSVEYYDTNTRDVIYDRPLNFSVGGWSPKDPYVQFENLAEMNNHGIELTLNTRNIETKDFSWTSTFTFARNWEEVVKVDLGNVEVEDLVNLGLFIGRPKDVFYDYKKIGIWQLGEEADAEVFGLAPGDVKIETSLTKQSDGVWTRTVTDEDGIETVEVYDASNQYTINRNDDRKVIGQAAPKWTAGFQNTFTYKNFDLSVFATARYGQTIDADLLGYFRYNTPNLPENYNYWTPDNPTNDFPRPYITRSSVNNPTEALRFVDGSYFKIKNITLGYSIPDSFTNRIGLNNLRVYGTIYNSLIITKSHLLKDLDPETSASDAFPLYRQAVFGINVSF